MSSSRIKGFYQLSLEDRVNIVTQDKEKDSIGVSVVDISTGKCHWTI